MGVTLKKNQPPSHYGQAGRQGVGLYRPAAHLLLIVLIGFLAYSNTFHSPFQWDESYFLTGNPAVKDPTFFTDFSVPEGMSAYSFKNRYIGYLTFALNYQFDGLNVTGYHIVNLAIHLINAMLVYFLVLLTFRTPYFRRETLDVKRETSVAHDQGSKPDSRFTIHDSRVVDHSPFTTHDSRLFALAVALLFVSHPLQTEAVTYVFQRFTSLVSMFYLLSLVLYIKARLATVKSEKIVASSEKIENAGLTIHDSRFTIIWYVLSLLAAVLAMKTKENAFTLPVVITLYEFLFFNGPMKARILRLMPLLLTMLIIPFSVMQIEGSVGEFMKPMTEPTASGYENLSRSEYLFTQFRVITTYLRLLLFPVHQNVLYDYPVYNSLFELPVLLSFIFLMFLFGSAVYLIYKSKKAISYQQSAKGNKQPSSSQVVEELSNGPTTQRLNDSTIHYFRLIAFGVLWFFITLSIESSILPLAMVIDEYRVYLPSAGFFLALASAAVLLLNQSPRFTIHNSRFTKVAAALFALIILGLASATYARNTLWKDKISLWEDVVSKNPNSPKAYNNLGIAYYEKGIYDKAIEMYKLAIYLSPNNFFAHSNLGVAYAVTGRIDLAIENLTKAISLDPQNGVAYANLARAYRRLGQYEKAAENYRKAVTLAPYNEMAFYGLGSTYMILREFDNALAAFTRFVELSPQNAEAYRSRGMAYLKKGLMSKAAEDFSKACSLGNRESCAHMKTVR